MFKSEIVSISKKVPQSATLPDGIYQGSWCGYIIELTFNKEIYELKTLEGIRGRSNVLVKVEQGIVSFDEIGLKNPSS
jgi:hypothetical protein